MLMKILDVLLSAVLVGAFLFVVYVTFDTLCSLLDAAAVWAERKTIELKQQERRKRHEKQAHQRVKAGEREGKACR